MCYRLENLKTCYDLITKHGVALQRALTELETGDDLVSKNKIVNERATLFRISSNAMINVSYYNGKSLIQSVLIPFSDVSFLPTCLLGMYRLFTNCTNARS